MAIKTIQELPDSATWEEIEERVRFLAAIDKGLEDIQAGKVVPHNEVKESLRKWVQLQVCVGSVALLGLLRDTRAECLLEGVRSTPVAGGSKALNSRCKADSGSVRPFLHLEEHTTRHNHRSSSSIERPFAHRVFSLERFTHSCGLPVILW